MTQPARAANQQGPRISPRARRLARRAGVDWARLAPGPAGRVSEAEVRAALPSRPSLLPAGITDRPLATLGMRVDMAPWLRLAGQLQPAGGRGEAPLLPIHALLKGVAESLLLHPRYRAAPGAVARAQAALQAKLAAAERTVAPAAPDDEDDDPPLLLPGMRGAGGINLAVATLPADGLRVCRVEQVNQLRVREVAERLADQAELARVGRLDEPDAASDIALVITDFSELGIDEFVPPLPPGHRVSLGAGPVETSRVGDGLVSHWRVRLAYDPTRDTLADAAAFLSALQRTLARPEWMLSGGW